MPLPELPLYLGLALLALGLRLAGLGAQPLSDAEASQALVSWHIYQGQPVDHVTYSPLLATLNLVGFALFGGSDFVARLAPALLGVALVLLPIGLRRQLGRTGALVAAALFAISPTALYLSRTASADIAAAVGGLALVVGLLNWFDAPATAAEQSSRQGWWLVPGAAGLALLLISSPTAYSILLLLVIFLAAMAVAPLAKTGDYRRRRDNSALRQVSPALRAQLAAHSGTFVAVLVVSLALATGFLFNTGGLAAMVDLIGGWARGFASPGGLNFFAPHSTAPGYPAILLLMLYEPLLMLAGLFGLAAVLMRRRPFELLLAWWVFGGLALDLLRAGRGSGEVLAPLVPLVLLAGLALGSLIEAVRHAGAWQREGIVVATGLVISTYAYIELMIYTRSPEAIIWLPLAAVGMFVILVVFFWKWHDGASTLRGAALVIVIALLLFNVAMVVRLNYTGMGDASQPLVRSPARAGIADLVETLEYVSIEKVSDPHLVDITATRLVGPAVEWRLRDFPNLKWVDSTSQLAQTLNQPVAEGSLPTVMISPPPYDNRGLPLAALSSQENYAGQDFVVRTSWSPMGMDAKSLIRWFILRTAQPSNTDQVVLWVRQGTK